MANDLSSLLKSVSIPVSAEIQLAKLGLADVMYDRLTKQIAEFERTLKADEEIAAHLASFGKEYIIQIHNVGFQNPYLIVFDGTDTTTGSEVRLLQHVSQINVLFVAVKVADLSRKPRRVGFIQEENPKSPPNL